MSLFAPQFIPWDLVIWVATGGGEKAQAARQLIWSEEELNAAKKQLYGRG